MKQRVNIPAGFLLIILISIGHSSFSQVNRLKTDLFTIMEDLTQTHINVVFQDSIGFLWIGTQDGLNKYDGYSFKPYRNQPTDTSSLSNNFIRAIDEDQQGNLWIATNGGLNFLDRKTGLFKTYTVYSDDSTFVRDQRIFAILAGQNGLVWFKTEEGLHSLDPETETIRNYEPYYDRFTTCSGTPHFNMLEDTKGRIWISTKDGLQVFNPETEKFKQYKHDPEDEFSLSSSMVRVIFEDSDQNIWIGTNSGLNTYLAGSDRFLRIKSSDNHNIRSLVVNCIYEDARGILWIGTEMGFYRLKKDHSHLDYHISIVADNKVVQISSVHSIIEDHSNIMWLGTFEGLVKFDTKPKKFRVLDKSPEGIPGLSSNIISSIYIDENGLVWLGTRGFGLNIVDPETGSVAYFSKNNPRFSHRISSDYIHSIYQDNDGQIWLGTSSGVNIYDKVNHRFRTLCEVNENISCHIFNNNSVFSIRQDSYGNIWFSAASGIHKYNLRSREIRSYYTIFSSGESFEITSAYHLIEDQDNMIWVGTENGLLKYNPELENFSVYQKNSPEGKRGLSSQTVYYLHKDNQDILWAGTASGLNKYQPETESFEYFTGYDGAFNYHIYSILEAGDSSLWLSTNRGLVRFNPGRSDFMSFNLSDGLQNYEFNIGSAFKTENGTFYFGGISGLNYFHPDSIQFNKHIPNVSFTNFEIDIGGTLGRIDLPLEKTEAFRVNQANRVFSIAFAALDFTAPENNLYMYSLANQGSEGQWIRVGNQHSVTFSNLSPGKYVLSVKGSNNDNVWNEEEVSINMQVLPPLWKSFKAYIVYVVVIGLLIFLLIQVRTRSLRRSNKILKEKELAAKEVEKQREELEVKNKNITDSINYAQRIQEALLPSNEIFKKILPNSFILYKPKDIVSGDFYWINEVRNKIYVAAVDCTGHGVPGAFVSIIGFELFRKLTTSEGIQNPAEIMNALNENFTEIFTEGDEVYLNDGMDLCLCVIDKKDNYLEYSGAFNPLYLLRDDTIIEIKANRFSVGADTHVFKITKTFKSHRIYLQKDDILYMFSDGYADQFGGPEGKKFKFRRFRHLLLTIHKLPLDKQHAILDASIEEWRGEYDQVDDIMVIGIRSES
ncbi:MAG: SpoIIE family protein phosphatase [Bacteroidales bacterium]|nr:SpoIIE family protein phosphatase [Bacteroidales bacterium]